MAMIQVTIRLDDGLLSRVDALVDPLTDARGIEQNRVSVLREAIVRGVAALSLEHAGAITASLSREEGKKKRAPAKK